MLFPLETSIARMNSEAEQYATRALTASFPQPPIVLQQQGDNIRKQRNPRTRSGLTRRCGGFYSATLQVTRLPIQPAK